MKTEQTSPTDTRFTKYCPDCKNDVPRTAFYKFRRAADGLQFICKSCWSDRYKLKNRERQRLYQARRREAGK